MKGKVININGMYFIEYITEANEIDAVEHSQVRLSLADHRKVLECSEVEFEIGDNGIATLINR